MKNPATIAICIMNQNSGIDGSSLTPRTFLKIANCAIAMKPYIPICHAVSEDYPVYNFKGQFRLNVTW
ncbi:hypothetical protein ACVW1A_008281 [Bradyrhizobium sp. LB1.3]